MNPIERRNFLKGTATGVFAFTVGGVEVILSARKARAQNAPFRLLKADEAQTIEALGETLVPGARAAVSLTSSISSFLFRRKKRCSKHASSMFARPTSGSIEVRLPPSTTPARR